MRLVNYFMGDTSSASSAVRRETDEATGAVFTRIASTNSADEAELVPATSKLLILLYLCCFTFTTEAISPNDLAVIYAELHEPILVHLYNGQTIPGHSIDVSGDQIQIATSEGAGEIIHTFNVNQVDRFTIPGDSYKNLAVEWIEQGNNNHAIQLMEMLYLQRVKILPLLPALESHFFIYYVRLILTSENPARAIAISEVLKPQISHPQALQALNDAILDSYNTLQLYEQTRTLTSVWLEGRNPYGDSALGYYTHSADLLRREDFEGALDSALQPIVFSTPNPPDKLTECYASAICAALGLRDKDYAILLYNEMLERSFEWPQSDPTYEPYFKQLNKYLEEEAPAQPQPSTETDKPDRPFQ